MGDHVSKTVNLPGLAMHVEEHGDGPAVLLLHGLGSSGVDWSQVVPRLASTRRVLVPDVRGHGRTDKPKGPYTIPLFARDVAALCDALQLREVDVVGLSMGGMIGFHLAVDRPDLVRSFTVVNSGPGLKAAGLRGWLFMRLRVLTLWAVGPKRLAQRLAEKLFPEGHQAELRRATAERLGANEKDVYLRSTRALVGWSVEDRLGEIACPVLVVHSEHDYTPLAFKQGFTQKLKRARLEVLAGSRHYATFDAADRLRELVARFLDDVTPASRSAVG
jgi:pimeloyl-ACP methyl ester carboxylesterase